MRFLAPSYVSPYSYLRTVQTTLGKLSREGQQHRRSLSYRYVSLLRGRTTIDHYLRRRRVIQVPDIQLHDSQVQPSPPLRPDQRGVEMESRPQRSDREIRTTHTGAKSASHGPVCNFT